MQYLFKQKLHNYKKQLDFRENGIEEVLQTMWEAYRT